MPEPVSLNRRIAATVNATGWPVRVGISFAMAGFLSVMALISFPLPWTPVPFSMMPFALLVAGATQRPGYAALSAGIYLLAGGLGAPIFAGGSSGWQDLFGATAGYLFGFIMVSIMVSAYMQRRHAPMSTRWAWTVAGFVAAAALAGTATIAWMWGTNGSFASLDSDLSSWGVGRSSLWALLFVTAGATTLTLWGLARNRGENPAALNLFVVMLASIIVLHACGVTVLWLATELSLMGAIVLGSIVFLPFDIIKAGLGVALTLPFLPTPANEDIHV